jgi:hypothetical protein
LDKDYTAALAKIYKIQQSAEDRRKHAFIRLQQADPWIVEQMKAHQQECGKFAAVEIKVGGEIIHERGELLPVKHDKYMRGR